MVKLWRGNFKLQKIGTLFAGTYIGAMVITWLLANDALMSVLNIVSKPGLWLAEFLVKYLRTEHSVTWLSTWAPPDMSIVVNSPLGTTAMSIIVIGVLFNVVIFYTVGYMLGNKM